ncbi:hypothetical protein EV426DRAFT_578949 [Tirmania nivea]|nr:hypothetical protein EV426DRAFT_578949 [Tirmania nivea]
MAKIIGYYFLLGLCRSYLGLAGIDSIWHPIFCNSHTIGRDSTLLANSHIPVTDILTAAIDNSSSTSAAPPITSLRDEDLIQISSVPWSYESDIYKCPVTYISKNDI